MNAATFAECFCAKNNVLPEAFARAVFKKILYPRARLVVWLLPLINRNYFTADFDLIYGVERLRRMREFTAEAERFNQHPANRGFLRRHLDLRISTKRLKVLIRETLPVSAGSSSSSRDHARELDSATPFEMSARSRG